MPAMRVLVVGAGLAGLTAASRLQDQGADVSLAESRHRVGGRVWSQRLEQPWGNVVFAGGHVNGTGIIDGAIGSGLAAADRFLESA